jgi:multicomponent Na+:H+ antiporter subunit D
MDPPVSPVPEPRVHFETAEERARVPLVMIAPIVVMVVVGMVVALAPGLADGVEHAAARFVDSPAYAERVIDGVGSPAPVESEPEHHGLVPAVLAALATSVVSIAVTVLLITRRRLPHNAAVLVRLGSTVVAPLRAVHSGHVGDYIAWLTVGVATFGGILATVVR